MGQFSWISVDTITPIYNDRPAGYQMVTMVYKDIDGNIKKVTESDYDGYGNFGGIDFYDAVAWMNNITVDEGKELRSAGINFYFSGNSGQFPQLYLSEPPFDIDFTFHPEDDPNQGWSYKEADLDYDEFDTYYDDEFDDDFEEEDDEEDEEEEDEDSDD